MGNYSQLQLRTLGRMDRRARTIKHWIVRRCRCAGEVTNLDESQSGARLLKRRRIRKERLLVLSERQWAMLNDREDNCYTECQEVISDEASRDLPLKKQDAARRDESERLRGPSVLSMPRGSSRGKLTLLRW